MKLKVVVKVRQTIRHIHKVILLCSFFFGENFKIQKKTEHLNCNGHFRHTEANLTLAHMQAALIAVLICQLLSHISICITVGEKLWVLTFISPLREQNPTLIYFPRILEDRLFPKALGNCWNHTNVHQDSVS